MQKNKIERKSFQKNDRKKKKETPVNPTSLPNLIIQIIRMT